MKPLAVLPWVAALFLSSALFSHTVALRLLLLALGVALAAAALATQRGSLRALPPIWLPFALWAAWAVLSLAWSIEPQRSLLELKNEIFYTGLALWVCYVAAQAPGARRIIVAIVGVAAIGACAVALYQWQVPAADGRGWHGGPGDHSSALLTLMPCALVAAWFGNRPVRWAAWGLVALFLLSAYSLSSRTVWLGFIAEFLVLATLVTVKRPEGNKLVVMGVVLVVIGAALAVTTKIQFEREAVGGARAIERDPRLALWPEVLQKIEARPLTGYGFGRGVLRTAFVDELKEAQLWHAHNVFLDVAVQVGLPGVVLLAVLLGATLRQAWNLSRDTGLIAAACGIALAAVVAGMVARNMTDMLWVRQNALLYWGMVGVLLGLGRTHAAAPR